MAGLTAFALNPRRHRVATLTDGLEEIRYQHNEDGNWYKHKFAPGASVDLMSDGSARISRRDGKPVWMDDEPLDRGGDDMHFFINPGSRRRASSRRRRRHKTNTRHPVARRRRSTKRETTMASHRRYRRNTHHRTTRRRRPARHWVRAHSSRSRTGRREHVRGHYANPRRRTVRHRRRFHHVRGYTTRRGVHVPAHYSNPRRRRRSYRRNAPFGVNFLIDGLKDGAGVKVGEIATVKLGNLAKQYVPGLSTMTGAAGTVIPPLIGATATAFIARKAVPRFSRVVTAGAFSQVIGALISLTPLASTLSAWPIPARVAAYPTLRPGLPAAIPAPGVRAWPTRGRGVVREVG